MVVLAIIFKHFQSERSLLELRHYLLLGEVFDAFEVQKHSDPLLTGLVVRIFGQRYELAIRRNGGNRAFSSLLLSSHFNRFHVLLCIHCDIDRTVHIRIIFEVRSDESVQRNHFALVITCSNRFYLEIFVPILI